MNGLRSLGNPLAPFMDDPEQLFRMGVGKGEMLIDAAVGVATATARTKPQMFVRFLVSTLLSAVVRQGHIARMAVQSKGVNESMRISNEIIRVFQPPVPFAVNSDMANRARMDAQTMWKTAMVAMVAIATILAFVRVVAKTHASLQKTVKEIAAEFEAKIKAKKSLPRLSKEESPSRMRVPQMTVNYQTKTLSNNDLIRLALGKNVNVEKIKQNAKIDYEQYLYDRAEEKKRALGLHHRYSLDTRRTP
jgi:hypothetical protein